MLCCTNLCHVYKMFTSHVVAVMYSTHVSCFPLEFMALIITLKSNHGYKDMAIPFLYSVATLFELEHTCSKENEFRTDR